MHHKYQGINELTINKLRERFCCMLVQSMWQQKERNKCLKFTWSRSLYMSWLFFCKLSKVKTIFSTMNLYTHFTLKFWKKWNTFLKFLEKMLFEKVSESFGWILQKSKFICDMGTFQSYLENWGEKRILTIRQYHYRNSKKK